jgi:hypothetical protein
MRRITEVFRLQFELELGQRAIARACSIGQRTVNTYLKAAQTAGISWPLPAAWDEPRLQEALFGKQRSAERPSQRVLPDFRAIPTVPGRAGPSLTRSVSWVSRRLALVRELPESIQEHVRRGEIVAHAAEKYLVPLCCDW